MLRGAAEEFYKERFYRPYALGLARDLLSAAQSRGASRKLTAAVKAFFPHDYQKEEVVRLLGEHRCDRKPGSDAGISERLTKAAEELRLSDGRFYISHALVAALREMPRRGDVGQFLLDIECDIYEQRKRDEQRCLEVLIDPTDFTTERLQRDLAPEVTILYDQEMMPRFAPLIYAPVTFSGGRPAFEQDSGAVTVSMAYFKATYQRALGKYTEEFFRKNLAQDHPTNRHAQLFLAALPVVLSQEHRTPMPQERWAPRQFCSAYTHGKNLNWGGYTRWTRLHREHVEGVEAVKKRWTGTHWRNSTPRENRWNEQCIRLWDHTSYTRF